MDKKKPTGIYDSSGIEIFEGDIIYQEHKEVYIVKWDKKKKAFVLVKKGYETRYLKKDYQKNYHIFKD